MSEPDVKNEAEGRPDEQAQDSTPATAPPGGEHESNQPLDAAVQPPDRMLEPSTEAEPNAGLPDRGYLDLAPVREAMEAVRNVPVGHSEAEPPPPVPFVTPMPDRDIAGAAATPVSTESRIGVLLVNLGTPDAPRSKAVRTYLREFLSDPRVIERDSVTWRLVLKGIILPFRPRRTARAYRRIWNRERNESPLKTITRAQAEQLAKKLAGSGDRVLVDWAMRYGNPSIKSRLRAMIAQGCERVLVLPLYPQYSAATTASVCDEVFRLLSRVRNQPALRVAPPYYDDPAYIEAVAASIEAAIAQAGFTPDVIVASYHGMPLEYVAKGDPYRAHCARTTELLRERLGFGETKLIMAFQSRFGRDKWLEPYTNQTLRKLAKTGSKNVAVVMPGFAADCLETLEEIAIENAHLFKKYGGKNFLAIPCLNDSARGMAALEGIVTRELKGWI